MGLSRRPIKAAERGKVGEIVMGGVETRWTDVKGQIITVITRK